jgi:uncharacterized membrane protein YphA (DoxX/SURF4 family)
MAPLRSVARAMLATMFISGGIDAIRNPDRLVNATKPLADQLGPTLDAVGLPTDPKTLVRLNGAAQVTGGVMLATGMAPRLGALTLAGSLVPTTFAGHPFWQEEDPDRRKQQRIHFFKNVSMLGGLLIAALDTGGRPGFTWRTAHLAAHAQDSLRRAARGTARETRRAAGDARRAAKATARETRIAVRAAKLGHRLP